MQPSTVPILRDIYDHNKLMVSNGHLINAHTQKSYLINRDFAITIDKEGINGLNRQFQSFYDQPTINSTYDFGEKIIDTLFWGRGLRNSRQAIINLLDLKPGASVLCVSIGTGRDLEFFPKDILPTLHIVGLDISAGMLQKCRKKCNNRNINIDLFLGNAESLPFIDNSFDTVFHFGGINFFNSPAKAVEELYRVAKPGTKIIYGDETPSFIKKNYKKMPIVKNIIKETEINFNPLDWLPPGATKRTYQAFGHDKMYAVTFIKKQVNNSCEPRRHTYCPSELGEGQLSS
jgi:ubiquinone/menaquinone biosynthesis C-methylase UbiE